MLKRAFDIAASTSALVVLSPVLAITAYKVKKELGSPVLFRQTRPGLHGRPFEMIKFRTMKDATDKAGIALPDSERLTEFGKKLRASSLDELPELWNVLKGDMSLVGPRPEVRKYVDMYTTEQRRVLAVRPGITDYASIVYMDENRLLGQSSNPDKTYVEDIMPAKIELNMRYINHPTLFEYFKLIFLTIFKIAR